MFTDQMWSWSQTFADSFVVGEKRELEEKGTQKVCSAHYTGHLIEVETQSGGIRNGEQSQEKTSLEKRPAL